MFRRKKPKHKVAYVSALNSEKRSKAPSLTLDCGSDFVSSVQSLPSYNLFATFSHDGIVRVYSIYTKGDVYREFSTHNTNVMSLVHVFDDVLAFVGDNGKIITWHAESGLILDELHPGKYHFTSICKFNNSQLVVGTVEGEVLIVSHDEGRALKIHESLGTLHTKTVKDIDVNGEIFISGGTDKTTVVYDKANSEQIASLRCNYWVRYVAVNSRFIITGAQDRKIYIRKNTIDCPNYLTVEFGDILQGDGGESVCVMAVSFITAELIMCTTFDNGILFFSLETAECIVRLNPNTEKGLQTSSILSDGRICVVGNSGYCAIFNAPIEVQDAVDRYAENMRHPVHSPAPLNSAIENHRNMWPQIISPKDGPEFGTVVLDASDTSMNEDESVHEEHNEDLVKELSALKADSIRTTSELAAQKTLLAAQKEETDRVLSELRTQKELFQAQKAQTDKLLKTIETQKPTPSNEIARRSLPFEKGSGIDANQKEPFEEQRVATEKLLADFATEKKALEESKRETQTVLLKQLAAQKAEANMVLMELATQKEDSQNHQAESKKKLKQLETESERRKLENKKITELLEMQRKETSDLLKELNNQKSETSKLMKELDPPASERGTKKVSSRAQISDDIEMLKAENRELKLLHSKLLAETQILTRASQVGNARNESMETGPTKIMEDLASQKKELAEQKLKSAKLVEDQKKFAEQFLNEMKNLKDSAELHKSQPRTVSARGLLSPSKGSKENTDMKEEIYKLKEELSAQKKLILKAGSDADSKQEGSSGTIGFGATKFESRKLKLEIEELRSILANQSGKTDSGAFKTQMNAAQEEIQELKKLFKAEIANNKVTPRTDVDTVNSKPMSPRPKTEVELAVEKEEKEALNMEFKKQKIEMDKLWKELNAQKKEFDAQRSKSRTLFKEWEKPEVIPTTNAVANGKQRFEAHGVKSELEDLKLEVRESKRQLAKQMRDIQQLSSTKQEPKEVSKRSSINKPDVATKLALDQISKELEDQKALTKKMMKELDEYKFESNLAMREIESEKAISLKEEGSLKIETKKKEAEMDRMEAELDMRKMEGRQQKSEMEKLVKELNDHKKETAWQKESMKKLILELEDQKLELETHKTETMKAMKDSSQKAKSENREVLHEFASRKASFDAQISRKTSYDSMASPSSRKVSTYVSKKGETKKLLSELEKQKVETNRVLKVLAIQKTDTDAQKEEMLVLMKEFEDSKAQSARLMKDLEDRKDERDNVSVGSSKKMKKSFGLARSTSQVLGIGKKSEAKRIMRELELQKTEVHRVVMELALQKEETDMQKQETRKCADEIEGIKMESSSMFLELETQKEELEAQKAETKKIYKDLSVQKSRTRKIYRELKRSDSKLGQKVERMDTDDFSVSVKQEHVPIRRNTHTDGFKSAKHPELD